MVDWKTHQELFEWDGSWRDLYILDTQLQDWQRLIDHLREQESQFFFTIDGLPHSLPANIETIFAAREQASPLLAIKIDHVQVNCHFFGAEQIEFDIDPREIFDANAFTLLLNFMKSIGSVLEKEVRLTPENMSEYILLRYNPATQQIETE